MTRVSQGMRPDGPDNHPLMAELYDLESSTWDAADDFFLSIANRRPASRVVDVGCGLGRLSIGMAAAGHDVTGIEPNAAFLARAETKEGAERVMWMHGTSSDLPTGAFDCAVMTGHVAQAFVDDDEWADALADLKRSLVPGGTVAFDSIDPVARGWERWDGGWSDKFPSGGRFASMAHVTAVNGEIVTFEVGTVLPGGELRHGVSDYRFRSEQRLRASVERAGFRIEAMFGGWHEDPVGQGNGEIVVVATV